VTPDHLVEPCLREDEGERAADNEGTIMTRVTYEVVQHDQGWAYKVDGVLSETFPSHKLAHAAAERAAREQMVAGNTEGIVYEDKEGRWHYEVASGKDRPATDVKG
jgi:hypothetical protein